MSPSLVLALTLAAPQDLGWAVSAAPGRVIFGVDDEDAAGALRSGLSPGLAERVFALPPGDAASALRALQDESGAACVIWLQPDTGGWRVTRPYGECGRVQGGELLSVPPRPAGEAPPVEVSVAEVPATVSVEKSADIDSSVENSNGIILTPMAPAAPVAPVAPADPAVVQRYARDRLVRGVVEVNQGSVYANMGYGSVSTVSTWGVSDGAGAPLSALAFARQVGDYSTLGRLESERRAAAVVGVLGGSLGLGALALGFNTLLEGDGSTALPLMLGGAAGLGVGVGVPVGLLSKQKYLARYYTTVDADRLIDAHNAELRQRLGLSPQDVTVVELPR